MLIPGTKDQLNKGNSNTNIIDQITTYITTGVRKQKQNTSIKGTTETNTII